MATIPPIVITVRRVEEQMLSEWFAAHDAYHKASDAYNDRVALVRKERERGNHSMNVNEEYRALHATQRRALEADENLWRSIKSAREDAQNLDVQEVLQFFRHRKRGTTYTVHNKDASLQCTDNNPPQDGERMVVYTSTTDGKEYVRPHKEFFDGRFEEIDGSQVTQMTVSDAQYVRDEEDAQRKRDAKEGFADV